MAKANNRRTKFHFQSLILLIVFSSPGPPAPQLLPIPSCLGTEFLYCIHHANPSICCLISHQSLHLLSVFARSCWLLKGHRQRPVLRMTLVFGSCSWREGVVILVKSEMFFKKRPYFGGKVWVQCWIGWAWSDFKTFGEVNCSCLFYYGKLLLSLFHFSLICKDQQILQNT